MVTSFSQNSLPPLPPVLAVATPAPRPPRKRERTRRQLIAAAARVYSARGIAKATVREITAVAEVTPVTFYNHFRSEAEMVQAVGTWCADTFCQRIVESSIGVSRGAERVAIGCRRFIWLAEESPPWASLIVDVAAANPALMERVGPYVCADLRLGVGQKELIAIDEAAALDLISGGVLQAMRRVVLGQAGRRHAAHVVCSILRGLGVPLADARSIVRRPLPAFPGDAA